MANFGKVTYTQYSSVLGRAIVPDETTFNSLKLLNIQLMKSWLPYVEEKETDGIDNAVCMMIETEYVDNQLQNGQSDNSIASESVNGHSISYGSTSRTKLEELNAKSTDQKKLDVAKLFLIFNIGIK